MQRFHLIIYSFILAFFVGIGILIAVSLIPYLHWIGVVALALLSIIVLCGTRILFAFTSSMVLQLHHRARTVNNGEIVVYHDGSSIVHLSALHEAAKVKVKELPPPKEVSPGIDDETILELYDRGSTLRTIAESTGLSYYKVQKIVASRD